MYARQCTIVSAELHTVAQRGKRTVYYSVTYVSIESHTWLTRAPKKARYSAAARPSRRYTVQSS